MPENLLKPDNRTAIFAAPIDQKAKHNYICFNTGCRKLSGEVIEKKAIFG